MIIKGLTIKNFGKIHDKSLTLSPGINVLYGENESGKTTTHNFIKSMFYGVQRQRGKAARNDAYTTYEPWENPAVYGGTLWFTSGGRSYRLSRNFHKSNQSSELFCEDTGELLDVEKGNLDTVLGGISEIVYENTVSVAQLKSVTGQDLVRELQNYMASYQGTGDSSVDLGRAIQMLKMTRKGYQVQADRSRRETQKEQERLADKMEYIRAEMEELKTRQSSIQEKEASLRMSEGEEGGEAILDGRIRLMEKRKNVVTGGMVLTFILTATALLLFGKLMPGQVLPMVLTTLVGVLLLAMEIYHQRQISRELYKRKHMKARWTQKQEKLKWNRQNLDEAYEEKVTALSNLQTEYQECAEKAYLPLMEETEIEAINLAMDTIEALSGNIHNQIGERLRERTSEILREITGGKYGDVLMDGDFHMMVNTQERTIPLERLSRGTMEQIYFALRMAAGELLCAKERFPVILDDVFGMYDEERLASVLHWLYKEKRQVIISTCHKREMEILDREGIPYEKLAL